MSDLTMPSCSKTCQDAYDGVRREERVSCCLPVTIADDEDVFYGVTRDISAGGVFIAIFDRLPVNGDVRLSFILPGACPARIEAAGQVVWRNSKKCPVSGSIPEGFGVEFSQIDPVALAALRAFIAAAATGQKVPPPVN